MKVNKYTFKSERATKKPSGFLGLVNEVHHKKILHALLMFPLLFLKRLGRKSGEDGTAACQGVASAKTGVSLIHQFTNLESVKREKILKETFSRFIVLEE